MRSGRAGHSRERMRINKKRNHEQSKIDRHPGSIGRRNDGNFDEHGGTTGISGRSSNGRHSAARCTGRAGGKWPRAKKRKRPKEADGNSGGKGGRTARRKNHGQGIGRLHQDDAMGARLLHDGGQELGGAAGYSGSAHTRQTGARQWRIDSRQRADLNEQMDGDPGRN